MQSLVHCLKESSALFFALLQCFCLEDTLSNVCVGSAHEQGLPILIAAYHLSTIEDPYPMAILVLHSKIATIEFTLAESVFSKQLHGPFKVLRVNKAGKGINGGGSSSALV